MAEGRLLITTIAKSSVVPLQQINLAKLIATKFVNHAYRFVRNMNYETLFIEKECDDYTVIRTAQEGSGL